MSIINLCLLKPEGGSIFLEVMKAKGEKKTAEWIANYHRDAAIRYFDGKVSYISTCICMDQLFAMLIMGLACLHVDWFCL